MNLKRIAQHLMMTPWQVKHQFPRHTLKAIEKAIHASEAAHAGEIRFVVEGALDGMPLFKGQSARERAIELFSRFRIWDTEHNNGVLIYLLLADRHVEIVADRGIHAKIGQPEWRSICHMMECNFKKADFEHAVIGGIQAVTQHLSAHFPANGNARNELPNKPLVI